VDAGDAGEFSPKQFGQEPAIRYELLRVGQSRAGRIRSVQARVVPGCPGGKLFGKSPSDR
jgi:hypothetical protein